MTTLAKYPANTNCLPDETLQEVFEQVCENGRGSAIGVLSLTFQRRQGLFKITFSGKTFILSGQGQSMSGKKPQMTLKKDIM